MHKNTVWVAMLLGGTAAAEEPKPEPPPVKVSGVIFAHYGLDLTEGADLANAFDLDRTYLKIDAKPTDVLGIRLTLDSNRESAQTVTDSTGAEFVVPEDPRFRVFVKHAWLEWKATSDISVKGGMIETVFVPFVEGYTGLRWTAKTFLDDNKLESSADLGVSVFGKHAKGLVSWAAGVYNGEFFSAPETGSGKSVQARFTVDPLAGEGKKVGLPISGFVDENLHEDPVDPALTWAGDVGFKHPNFLFSAEVAGRSQGELSGLGQSVQITPGAPDVGYVVARLDRWDPDTSAADDGTMKIWAGAAHDFHDKISLGAFYERIVPEAPADIPSQGLYVRAQAGW
jgi:hypothetical protein